MLSGGLHPALRLARDCGELGRELELDGLERSGCGPEPGLSRQCAAGGLAGGASAVAQAGPRGRGVGAAVGAGSEAGGEAVGGGGRLGPQKLFVRAESGVGFCEGPAGERGGGGRGSRPGSRKSPPPGFQVRREPA